MNQLSPQLQALGTDLQTALARFQGRRRRRRRVAVLAAAAMGVFASAAVASDIGPDLQLDPTEWAIVARGGDSDGAKYVKAERRDDGRTSVFLVVPDDGLRDRYDAYLWWRRTAERAGALPPGGACTRETIAEVQRRALAGEPAATIQADVHCDGVDYAIGVAQSVASGAEPRVNLMPGAR